MKLSILICSHFNRRELLKRMVACLESQKTNEVEILTIQNNDAMMRGRDRNALLDKAAGEYCVFVDDDDVVSDDYVSTILAALKSEPDICSITGIVTSLMDNKRRRFVLALRYDTLFSLPSNQHKENTYYRFSSHLCPIRTELARKIKFPLNMFHEDNGYSDRLKKFTSANNLKENYIDKPIYYYFSRILIEK